MCNDSHSFLKYDGALCDRFVQGRQPITKTQRPERIGFVGKNKNNTGK